MAKRLDARSPTGGIFKLLEILENHPAELAFDFRSKFQISIFDIGRSVTYLEALYLIAILLKDTTSWVTAAKSGWKHPASREWIVTKDLFDLTPEPSSITEASAPLPSESPSSPPQPAAQSNNTLKDNEA